MFDFFTWSGWVEIVLLNIVMFGAILLIAKIAEKSFQYLIDNYEEIVQKVTKR